MSEHRAKRTIAGSIPLRFATTAHGDPDLESRYRDRVKVPVKLAVREARDGQDLP
jgi:hypothetical protein